MQDAGEGMKDDRERRIADRLQKCVHFNGLQHECCEVGVVYKAEFPDRKPCLGNLFEHDKRPIPDCPKMQRYTREESEEEERNIDRAIAQMEIAVPAAKADAKEKGLGKGNGGFGSIACPICTTGQLRYSVASYNGHMHACCTTDHCVNWME